MPITPYQYTYMTRNLGSPIRIGTATVSVSHDSRTGTLTTPYRTGGSDDDSKGDYDGGKGGDQLNFKENKFYGLGVTNWIFLN
ncbi:hypothetical protein V6N12_031218 [Hibiscus sabdariffa]|uniref:Uncharacterized protein n=1 Tax=Hibiscus sabdariffa TaxID=183260 RepID=A0ABR2E8D6_9ROSI